jgi:UDP-glucose 4-epimerase
MHILITGGTGYIGSHATLQLLKTGHKVTILDNFSNSDENILEVLKTNGGEFEFINADLRNFDDLRNKLIGKTFDACIHFAAFIEVGRSVHEPENFFDNNVVGSQNLFKVLIEIGVKKVIFSSTAAVYGTPKTTPIKESDTLSNENPYATSKLIIEKILEDYSKYKGINVIALRYFNPAGSFNGIIGEMHKNESHVIPRFLRTYTKPEEYKAKLFGIDYPTPDGTAIRDYIHIMDLVDAHIMAVNYLDKFSGYDVFNIGTGNGTSVKELIKTIENVVGKPLVYEQSERRSGDSPILVAGVDKISEKMGWKAKFGLKEIVESAWEWEKKN